jgi:SPW repeat-containing protein
MQMRKIQWRRETSLDVHNLALAAFLFVAPWLFSYASQSARADDWVSSAIVLASSVAVLLAFREWEAWVSMIVGLWVLASPWLLGFQHAWAMVVNVTVGALIAFVSALELWLIHYYPKPYDGKGQAVT